MACSYMYVRRYTKLFFNSWPGLINHQVFRLGVVKMKIEREEINDYYSEMDELEKRREQKEEWESLLRACIRPYKTRKTEKKSSKKAQQYTPLKAHRQRLRKHLRRK